jgi:hypothetical protein
MDVAAIEVGRDFRKAIEESVARMRRFTVHDRAGMAGCDQ